MTRYKGQGKRDNVKRTCISGSLFILALLTGCTGPDPVEMGIIGFNLTFGVAAYSWIIIVLLSWISGKIGKGSLVIPKKPLLYQLGAISGIAAMLSITLFAVRPYDIYPVFSRSALVEWTSLQLYSFMVLPIIAIYLILAYLVTTIPVLRKYRPFNLTIAVIVHWLFSAHFFLVR